ncbi:hypothetical protein TNCV_2784231, partial [Trichonephila clavipes]
QSVDRGSLNGHDQEFEAVVVKSLVLVLMLLKIYRVEVADISEICRGSKFSRWLVWKLGDWGTQLPDNPPGIDYLFGYQRELYRGVGLT